jgi:hypothetical protein
MIRKISALTLSIIMAFSIITMAATSFSDVTAKSHSWAMDAISAMADKKIINGYPDGTFLPDKTVTKMESLLLISRILGFSSVAITDNIDSIYALYSDDLKSVSSQYKKELSYLLFTGTFTIDETSEISLDKPLTREEAAFYITKAAKAEEEAVSNMVVLNAYTDDTSISEAYRKFVYYVRDESFMMGTGNDKFSPKENLTRAQIATLLYRVMAKFDITVSRGTIDSVNVTNNTAKVFVVAKTYDVDSTVVVRNKGMLSAPSALYKGLNTIVTMVGDNIAIVDAFFDELTVEKKVDGEVKNVSTGSDSLQLKSPDDGQITTYKISDRCVITVNGSDATINNVRSSDYAVLELDKYDKAISISVLPVSKEITDVTISDLIINDTTVSIEVTDKSKVKTTYTVNPNVVTIRKNGTKVEFSKLNIGDKVSKLTLKYNRIESIDANSEISSNSGLITEILISNASSVKLQDGSNANTFLLNKDSKIYVFGEVKTIYDLRLAHYAKITLDGNMVSKIEISTQSQNADAKGEVTAVNQTAGLVTIRNTDGVSVVIYVSTSKTKIIDNGSTSTISKTIKDIKTGQNITAIGTLVNGVFEAQTIVITN